MREAVSAALRARNSADVVSVNFQSFTMATIDPNINIYGPAASVVQDLEPEYIAISKNSKTAYVALQENNAIAVIDIETAAVTKLFALGGKVLYINLYWPLLMK
ncbi:Alkaline phosphatase [hydrothermal vent metagenome]|uniref:Alkaline phosphatase n=1 Tax=hydrothermal vent metagenome TaxID=652676 RepID=A0A3B0ZQ16_9ZZZZ